MLVMLHVVVVVGASASLTHRLYVGVIMIRFECLLWHAAFAASCRWLKTEGPPASDLCDGMFAAGWCFDAYP